jgi:hypothetical protein
MQEIINYRWTTPERESRRLPGFALQDDQPYLKIAIRWRMKRHFYGTACWPVCWIRRNAMRVGHPDWLCSKSDLSFSTPKIQAVYLTNPIASASCSPVNVA